MDGTLVYAANHLVHSNAWYWSECKNSGSKKQAFALHTF